MLHFCKRLTSFTILEFIFLNAKVFEIYFTYTFTSLFTFYCQDKESMRSLSYHQGYDLLFTLVNPQPDILNVDWSIQQAVEGEADTLKRTFRSYLQKFWLIHVPESKVKVSFSVWSCVSFIFCMSACILWTFSTSSFLSLFFHSFFKSILMKY